MSEPPDFAKSAPAGLRRAQFLLAQQALTQALAGLRPADAILQDLFRANRQCGSRDRALVAELLYGVLRDWRRLQALAAAARNDARSLSALRVLDTGQADAATLEAWGVADAAALAARLRAFDPATLSPAERCNMPDDCYERLRAQYGEGEAAALAQALNQPARVDLRVNTLKADRDSVRQRLAEDGLRAEPTPLSPLGLRLPARAPLQNLAPFREGWIEPQDEGSQLIALLLAPAPGETVVDFCAGAGGKTLALGAQMCDRGELLACDVSAARLERLRPRLLRAGLSCVEPLALRDERDPALARYAGRCDAVLVDAPCSATGTWRRNPELRLRTPDFAALQAQQLAIVAAASLLVKPGGRLVYATCSLMAEENEQVVRQFLAAQPQFALQDAGALLQARGIDYQGAELRLLPQRDGTDGFYAAALRRTRA